LPENFAKFCKNFPIICLIFYICQVFDKICQKFAFFCKKLATGKLDKYLITVPFSTWHTCMSNEALLWNHICMGVCQFLFTLFFPNLHADFHVLVFVLSFYRGKSWKYAKILQKYFKICQNCQNCGSLKICHFTWNLANICNSKFPERQQASTLDYNMCAGMGASFDKVILF